MQSPNRPGGARRLRRSVGGISGRQQEMFEQLESRVLMYTPAMLGDLPDMDSLADPGNTVVRFATDFGNIDIELFDRAGPDGESENAAPRTAANFVSYVSNGRFDNTFFHRLVRDFVLQGGGFIFEDGEVDGIETGDAIENEFDDDRPNVERTIAMAKLPGQPDSATSQFFFNLKDNPTLNDSSAPDIQDSGGFTVFGRVIKGWDVVLQIAGFDIVDYSDEGNALGEVPVAPAHNDGDPISNAVLVNISDAEVIKAADAAGFYSQAFYYPEGFASRKIIELLELANPDTNAEARYQVIVRYEGGRQRDDAISRGRIEAGGRSSLLVSDFGGNDPGIVQKFRPYAIEVWATGPIGVALNHFDFGAASSESFTSAQPMTEAQLREWTFGSGRVGDELFSFLVFQNLSLQNATVTIEFWPESAASPQRFTKVLEPLRRGGLNVGLLEGIPDGRFSVRVTSDRPIAAAMSQYETAADEERASTANGMVGGPAPEGILAAARIPSGSTSVLRVQLSPDAVGPTIVDFDFILDDGTLIEGNPLVLAATMRTRDYDLAAASAQLPRDEFFSIRYRVRTGGDVTVHYTAIEADDQVSTPFQTFATNRMLFASAFLDPARANTTFDEVLSIFNPFERADANFMYRVGFMFTDDNDGQSDEILFPSAAQGTLDPLSRIDLRVRDLAEVLAKVQSGGQFRSFSIVIETTAGSAVVAQLTRIDSRSNDSFTSLGMLGNGIAISLSDPRFDPSTPG